MTILPGYGLTRKVLLAALLLTAACSDRERTNPLDPRNPDRDRANIGFNALAGDRQVLLEWDRLDFIDLAGVRVQRVEAGTTDTVTVTDSSLALSVQRYIDNTPENGITYTYHLAFDVTGSDENPTTLADTVTPGPVFSWVELIDYGEIVLFTPDFRDEVVSLQAAFYGVADFQVAGTIWVLDFDGTIHRFQRNGELIGSAELQNVSAFAFDQANGSSWVALKGDNGLVYHFHENGELLSSKATNIAVTSMAVDRLGNGVWLGSSSPMVIKVNAASPTSTVTQIDLPTFVSPELVVSTGGLAGAWIGDRGSKQVYYVNSVQLNWSREGFAEINDIAVDFDGNYCWVADATSDEITILDGRDGVEIATVSGFGNPYYLAYNVETNTVLVSGSSGMITSISPDGEVLWRIQNPDRTGKIVLAY